MTLLLVHLSDIHIKSASDPVLDRARSIAAATFESLPGVSHIVIVVSGDIAFSGNKSQYDLATAFLRELRDALMNEAKCECDYILVPGNHDCDFSQEGAARRILVSTLVTATRPEVDDSVIQQCIEPQRAFRDFRSRLEIQMPTFDDGLWRTTVIEIGSHRIQFDTLNLAWVSRLDEQPGKLVFPFERYDRKRAERVETRIIVMHHPFNWLSQAMYRPLRQFLREIANIVMTGHEHVGNVGITDDLEAGSNAFIEGGVLQLNVMASAESTFNVVTLDLDNGQFATKLFTWNDVRYEARQEGAWSSYRDLPEKQRDGLSITAHFKQFLDDSGGPFQHPAREQITLADVFVYPDLKVSSLGDRKTRFVRASILRDLKSVGKNILLSGDEKSGRTALLRQLFRDFYEQGFIPILLLGAKLRRQDAAAVSTVIHQAVEEQYGPTAKEPYAQLSAAAKVILIDDFESSPLQSSDARTRLLREIATRANHLIVTVSELAELREFIGTDNELATFEHFTIQPFGHVLRANLVERWYSLGRDSRLDDEAYASKCDRAEQLMNSVMTRSVVPSSPLYLLTLLQSLDGGHTGEFREGALGYYYQFLLTAAFQRVGVTPDRLTEFFQYCVHLAWFIHKSGNPAISETELREFNAQFSERWHTVDLETRLQQLLEARVIAKNGDEFGFRYPYIFYYFKGQFLSQSLNDIETRAYVEHCCEHLYVRDHANTILFLAHHTNDDFVLRSLTEALQKTFSNREPTELEDDTSEIVQLIAEAPKLRYKGGSPATHRNERNRLSDELGSDDDGLVSDEQEDSAQDLGAQMASLFKTTEILGHVLKNQYAKIPRTRKVELLQELFAGPLRALNDFFSFAEKNRDFLVRTIDVVLKDFGAREGESKDKLAKKIAATLVLAIVYNFVMRAASSASSKALAEDVEKVVKKGRTIALRLIDLAITLEGPGQLPRKKIRELRRDIGERMVASRVMQLIVLNRLYMFPMREKDMQWLADEMGVDLQWQHQLSYTGAGGRMLERE